MKRLLFVTRNFPPLVGGMERLAAESVRALSERWPIGLVGPRGSESFVPPGCAIEPVAHESAIGFLLEGRRGANRMASRFGALAVIGGSGLAAPLVTGAARRAGAPAICFVHGLDLVARHPVYRALCLPPLRRMDCVIANSRNTAHLAAAQGIPASRIRVLHPGVEDATAPDPALSTRRFPRAAGRRLLLSVGRLLPRKGVVRFVERVLPGLVDRYPDLLLVIVGDAAPDALSGSGSEPARLQRAIRQLGLEHHVLLTGRVAQSELDAWYAVADLMVFPIMDLPGDVEGFGMVALEAAAHGLPTVAFAAGGVADAVADGVSGRLVPPGDYYAMGAAIEDWLVNGHDGVDASSCRRHAAAFAWPLYGERLRAYIEDCLQSAGGHRA